MLGPDVTHRFCQAMNRCFLYTKCRLQCRLLIGPTPEFHQGANRAGWVPRGWYPRAGARGIELNSPTAIWLQVG